MHTRLALILAVAGSLHASADDRRTYRHDGQTLTYRLHRPAAATAQTPLPLVLCLHGRKGSTTAGKRLVTAPSQARHPCWVMSPRCDSDAHRWASHSGLPDRRTPLLPLVLRALRALLAEQPGIDRRRVYVTGQSMGGVGTWGALASAPDLFAAGAPVCGGWRTSDAPRIAPVPVWVFHGARDPKVPVQLSRDMVAALRRAGAKPRYTEYPNVAHDAWNKAYSDATLWRWLFAQRKPDRDNQRDALDAALRDR